MWISYNTRMALESIPFAPSNNIQSIWYDLDSQLLVIRFHDRNRVYRYSGVSGEEANGFANSLSAGDYLNRVIRGQHAGEFVGVVPESVDGTADIDGLQNLLALK